MVTDTNRFFYPCTTSHTLKIASKLSKILKNKCYEINQTLCKRTLEEIKIEQKIKSLIKYDLDNGIAYLSIPKNFFTLNKITPSSYIYTMSNIEGINI
jgi:nanoRNase/pAp phosphatase (c-di-AMP/oligoRNAs hydrolase)